VKGRERQLEKKSVTIFFTAAEQSHQFPNLPKSKSGKSGLWSLAGADFETGATERALSCNFDAVAYSRNRHSLYSPGSQFTNIPTNQGKIPSTELPGNSDDNLGGGRFT
jgi:hypothetical protein